MPAARNAPRDLVWASFNAAFWAWRNAPGAPTLAFFAGAAVIIGSAAAFPPADRSNPFEPNLIALAATALATVWVTGSLHQVGVDHGDGVPPSLRRMAHATPWPPVTAACGAIALVWIASWQFALVPAVLTVPITQYFVPAAFDQRNGGWRFPIAAWRAFVNSPAIAIVTTGVILAGYSLAALTAGLAAFVAFPVLALGTVDVYRLVSPSTALTPPGLSDPGNTVEDEEDFL